MIFFSKNHLGKHLGTKLDANLVQVRFKMAQVGPKTGQEGDKMGQDVAKMAPRGPKTPPRRLEEASWDQFW